MVRRKQAKVEPSEGSVTYSVEDIVRSEIEGAVVAIVRHLNYVAAHVLASAAFEVMRGHAKRHDLPLRADIFQDLKECFGAAEAKPYIDTLNQPYNAMKHSQGTDGATIHPHYVELITAQACKEFGAMFGFMTPRMAIYVGWSNVVHERLRKTQPQAVVDAFASAALGGSRADQLREAREQFDVIDGEPILDEECRERLTTKRWKFPD